MDSKKLKIFVSAYACEPNLGSEIGVGWHWVIEMSKYFDLWVLTRKSNQQTIEDWLNENELDNKINFLYYDLPPKLRFWKKGLRGVRTYYVLWQKLTNGIVKRTMEENGIDIYHMLTYGNALWPASSYGKSKFFIWGPTGVGDTIPSEYSKYYSKKGRAIEWVRRMSVKSLPLNYGFNKRCRSANLIFCKTERTKASIPNPYKKNAIVFTDVAVEKINTPKYSIKRKESDDTIYYLAVGRFDAWRGFDLLIEAFAHASIKNPKIRLDILGNGSDKKRLEDLINKFEMQQFITLTGQVPKDEYYRKIANCDVVVNPALKEGAVTTAFDSMSFSKPLICIDTGGYTAYFNNEYSVVIPRTSRIEVIERLSEGIIQLTNKEERDLKGKKAKEVGAKFDWEHKGQRIFKEITKKYSEFQRN